MLAQDVRLVTEGLVIGRGDSAKVRIPHHGITSLKQLQKDVAKDADDLKRMIDRGDLEQAQSLLDPKGVFQLKLNTLKQVNKELGIKEDAEALTEEVVTKSRISFYYKKISDDVRKFIVKIKKSYEKIEDPNFENKFKSNDWHDQAQSNLTYPLTQLNTALVNLEKARSLMMKEFEEALKLYSKK